MSWGFFMPVKPIIISMKSKILLCLEKTIKIEIVQVACHFTKKYNIKIMKT